MIVIILVSLLTVTSVLVSLRRRATLLPLVPTILGKLERSGSARNPT